MVNLAERKRVQRTSYSSYNPQNQVSFKGMPNTQTLHKFMSEADEQVIDLFSKHYGTVSDRLVEKIDKLIDPSEKVISATSRIIKNPKTGNLQVKEKNIFKACIENLLFPFINIPLYSASWILAKIKDSNFSGKDIDKIKAKAANWYKENPILRNPRKINELNEKSNQIQGVLDKTRELILDFIKKKGPDEAVLNKYIKENQLEGITNDYLKAYIKKGLDPQKLFEETKGKLDAKNSLENVKDYLTRNFIKDINEGKNTEVVQEANEYIKEKLYKLSNKFFDKNTGNFNTAHERPLNRLVTGLVPVAFLANDAYNLSVLCGDKKEDSKKEAHLRAKQEITRVGFTAYVQLLVFGAFTKLVNTKSWFTPLMSAGIVFVSELISRTFSGKPLLPLTKESAKKYNKREREKQALKAGQQTQSNTSAEPVKPQAIDNKPVQNKQTYTNILKSNANEPKIFASFKGTEEKQADKTDKPKEQKALINFDTFKKGILICTGVGIAVSFLKNSSYFKNTKVMKKIRELGELWNKNVYKPLAYKTFKISESDFNNLMNTLDEAKCSNIADGHRYIKEKYKAAPKALEELVEKGIIKKDSTDILMPKGVVDKSKVIEKVLGNLKDIGKEDTDTISKAIKTAIDTEGANVAEMKFDEVAKKAVKIIKNKKVELPDEEMSKLAESITEAITDNSSQTFIEIPTKLKPFIDVFSEPFKFIWSVINLPFRKVITPIANILTGNIQKKAKLEALGEGELEKYERIINKVFVEIFGESKEKSGKISQEVFAGAMEALTKASHGYTNAKEKMNKLIKDNASQKEIEHAKEIVEKEKDKLEKYVKNAVAKSFDGVTQSKNKNTDVAMMTKLVSSAVTSIFLVLDNYNMVMIKSDGENKEDAKEKANERIIQRLSGLFYQTMLINWFNSTFKSTYNKSLSGMASVAIPNTLTTEIITRKSIGMPIGRKTYEELIANEEKNENRTGFLGKYFKFMRLLTGKKPLKDRLPKDKKTTTSAPVVTQQTQKPKTTNLLEMYSK